MKWCTVATKNELFRKSGMMKVQNFVETWVHKPTSRYTKPHCKWYFQKKLFLTILRALHEFMQEFSSSFFETVNLSCWTNRGYLSKCGVVNNFPGAPMKTICTNKDYGFASFFGVDKSIIQLWSGFWDLRYSTKIKAEINANFHINPA